MNLTGKSPVINSLLDTDFYKFTMAQLIFRRYGGIRVEFNLIDRSHAPLARFIDEGELRGELDHIRTLCFNNTDLHYLRGTNEYGERMFGEDFLDFLKNLELPSYTLARKGESYDLSFEGPWPAVTLWEIPALAVINELYFRRHIKELSRFERDAVCARGIDRLKHKIKTFREYPGISFSDFGSRRRFSRVWHYYLVGILAEELPENQFRGTSNVKLAMDHGLMPMGTSGHELLMAAAASGLERAEKGAGDFEILVKAQDDILREWYKLYGEGLSIALTDTFGSDFFFRTATGWVAEKWKGLRQDSGDPFDYGEKAMKWYLSHGIDPKNKLIVFSDQLNVELAVKLHLSFRSRIGHTFGIGTNLTNDLGFKPISIVVKALKADGRSTVKLSDNPAKSMGNSGEIERYKKAVGYNITESVECVS